ncbi:GNAT family N-acetyltransferase [Paludibacterium purpuratum]|uniref:Putative acetyltransferase n=1 Tax=Paludibacterium purpuratum TaxID=1144873 RepID=A0A4R7B1S3_9NEIS|nr:GNAT family N-acetyltransferase [Paludibacterium purpuratum]TDR73561.1 putative acetyltransferase [Paludibacterium purpuratum]
MRLRPYQPGEEPKLWDLYLRLGKTGQSRQQWLTRLQCSIPFVVEYDRQVIGYANLDNDGVIDHFFVRENWQGRGVGTLLMEKMHKQAANQRLSVLTALVCRESQSFFARWGFVLEPGQAVGADNAFMRKNLR